MQQHQKYNRNHIEWTILSYAYQPLDFDNKISCAVNGYFFYFNEDEKLHLLNIPKQIFPAKNEYISVISIERTDIIWNKIDANILYVYIRYGIVLGSYSNNS